MQNFFLWFIYITTASNHDFDMMRKTHVPWHQKKTFGLEIIFLLDPVIEQVNMDTNLLPIKYFEPAAHMYTEVQRLNNGKYKF